MKKYLVLFLFITAMAWPPPAPEVPQFVKDSLSRPLLKVLSEQKYPFDDLSEFNGHYIVPQNHMNSASHDLSTEKVKEGTKSHKSWMYGTNPVQSGVNNNHRAYPTLQMGITSLGTVKTMALIDMWVYTDIQLTSEPEKDWISLATLTSYADNNWAHAYLVNLDKDYKLHLMHVPTYGVRGTEYVNPSAVPFPKDQWVRLTILVDYTSNNQWNHPTIFVWQDEVLVTASKFNPRLTLSNFAPGWPLPSCLDGWDGVDIQQAESLCGLVFTNGLAQMHFGLYAPPLLSAGAIYNDGLTISEVGE